VAYHRVAASAFALVLAAAVPAAVKAGEGDYIGLFGGTWSGSGIVLNDATPWQVSCRAVGKPGPNHLVIKGSCSVFLASFDIAAEVTFDPASGRYSGVYNGGDQAARISGRRDGDTVDFVMTWSRPVNGETRARMTIVNGGRGDFRILIDSIRRGAPEERTSDLLLTQR
jgi:hypothetical protein